MAWRAFPGGYKTEKYSTRFTDPSYKSYRNNILTIQKEKEESTKQFNPDYWRDESLVIRS